METLKRLLVLFGVGGIVYVGIEFIWRGKSHPSMFLVGGLCFVSIGLINEVFTYEMPLILQMFIASAIITVIEFAAGLIVNIYMGLAVWDYSDLPFNVMGQISILFSILWFFLSAVGIILDDYLRYKLWNEEKPRYTIFFKNKNGQ